jgi:hypothetical protein
LSGPSSSQIVCTTVLKLRVLEENSLNEGSAEIGVCVVDLVVGTIAARSESEGGGPVTVGCMPVQYDTVVLMVGVGKTKLIAVPAYEIILVVASWTTADVTPVVEELVVMFKEEEVVFIGGTMVTKTLEKVAPGTPPVVVDVEVNEEDDEVLVNV